MYMTDVCPGTPDCTLCVWLFSPMLVIVLFFLIVSILFCCFVKCFITSLPRGLLESTLFFIYYILCVYLVSMYSAYTQTPTTAIHLEVTSLYRLCLLPLHFPWLLIATDLPRHSVPDGAVSLPLKCQFERKVVPSLVSTFDS